MKGKVSPIFALFQQQFEAAKSAFDALSKQYRGKKALELENKLIFLEIYIDLLSKIHFEEEQLKFRLFSPFKKIFKGLKKTKHIKMIMAQTEALKLKENPAFHAYLKSLETEKNQLYNEVYDLIISSPLQIWETLYHEAHHYSKGIKPLMINTATTQIINEELSFFQVDNNGKLDSKVLKDIYEGIRVITALENLRIESGFNPIFVQEVHERMSELQKTMLKWYENHLFIQHLVAFLTDKEEVSKKYLDLLSSLQGNRKNHIKQIEDQCAALFERILE
ncbi:hypothetical protein [Cecembia calidifontis]|uniref:CHAD domain-containing protein n=1 Tax=Cecembia calidifontis TaxID=1187080 RepID=A0A4V2F6G8_9BACT|nr:hypothetical protein [Cecembia calidifontis]RZS96269.1 hypothetical protein BC751_1836 [Cecembia calidifontis]